MQLDYILFLYGLAFILLGAICYALPKSSEDLPWRLLGLFGFIHGANEWLDLVALVAGDARWFAIARLAVMAVSFIALSEFARGSLRQINQWAPGRWIYAPLLTTVALAAWLGQLAAANVVVRYAFCLPAGMASGIALVVWGQRSSISKKVWLSLAGFGLFGYALAAGVVVPPAPFPPASVVNYGSFFHATGLHIQLLRGYFAFVIAVAIWAHAQGTFARNRRRHLFIKTMAILLVTLVAGWLLTERLGTLYLLLRPDQATMVNRLLGIVITLLISTLIIAYYVALQHAANDQLQLQELSEILARQATTDSLSGLLNRAGFNHLLGTEIARARRYNLPLSAILFDVDHFKTINDQLGHQAGDRVLMGIAHVVATRIREVDSVARWGGDEFVILAPHVGADGAFQLANQVRVLIADSDLLAGRKVTCSFGVTEISAADTESSLLQRVDEALYRAKAAGRNRVELG